MWRFRVVLLGLVFSGAVAAMILFGWGLASDLNLFFQATPRAAGLTVASLAAFLAAPGFRFLAPTRTEAKGQEWLAVGTDFAYALSLWIFPFLEARSDLAPFLRVHWSGFPWVGVALFAGGQALMVWAIYSLGQFFTAKIGILPGHKLVDTGPYARIRHPFYSGVLLSMIGFPAIFGSWVGPIAVVAFLPLMIFRMNVEERLLEAEFGEAYETMKAETWRLLPFVY